MKDAVGLNARQRRLDLLAFTVVDEGFLKLRLATPSVFDWRRNGARTDCLRERDKHE
jgi:hypothetical protein